jgi:hypothetical protein
LCRYPKVAALAEAPFFVELHRDFIPVRKDTDPNLDLGRLWGRRFGGWLNWGDLQKRHRVVLLAEASSGKSAEFRNQVEQRHKQGSPAFYVRIEELADQGFRASLSLTEEKMFERWRRGTSEAWFFLDSIDEARLNRKSFETALKHFARDVSASLERTHIFISCRVTDWKNLEDRQLISRWLPAWEPPTPTAPRGANAALLDPIFNRAESSTRQDAGDPKVSELLVVQLASLSQEQCRALAIAAGVVEADAFVSAIERAGLDSFTERPGDMLDLAGYWRDHQRFGSFAEMVENGITRKLAEMDSFRSDNQFLSPTNAREGAERIAAALTFGKSFTLRAPSYDPDPSLSSGAMDPAMILHDWTEAERNTLLRRGIFAPATYGRVRFHHRGTQEYLTACWLNRLLRQGCPVSQVWDLLFVTRYGVETVVPSLRATAAWIALWYPKFAQEIIRREPLALIRHGDPGSLSVDMRKHLLLQFASKQAGSEISDDSLDSRALWMFADKKLGTTIRKAWANNHDRNFRADLLRLIREGSIDECKDLARSVACSRSSNDYDRIVALQALEACKDSIGLRKASRMLLQRPEKASARVAAAFALVLYPIHISTDDLLLLIAKCRTTQRRAVEGFPEVIEKLSMAAPDATTRGQFLGGLAKLCLTPPFSDRHHRISADHKGLAARLYRIAQREASQYSGGKLPSHLIPLLMAVERAEDRDTTFGDKEERRLHAVVRSNEMLNRALFWADVKEQRLNATKEDRKPIHYWQVWFGGDGAFWDLSERSLEWLYTDLCKQRIGSDRRIALSGIVSILQTTGRLKSATRKLRTLVSNDQSLANDLHGYLRPPTEDQASSEHKRWMEDRETKNKKQAKRDRASWVRFQRQLKLSPRLLKNPSRLRSWSSGIFRLSDLTRWLEWRTRGHYEKAPRDWRLLEEGFGRKVAESYRDGMQLLWRTVPPERPRGKPGQAVTVKWQTILAFAGIGLEAIEDPDWASRLSKSEARIATRHGCLSDQGYPEWIDALIISHPQIAVSIIKREIESEWTATVRSRSNFLPHYGATGQVILQPLQKILIETIYGSEAGNLIALDRGVDILRNLTLDGIQRKELIRVARKRFAHHQKKHREDYALHYLAALLLLNLDEAVDALTNWLEAAPADSRQSRAERTLGMLFERRNPLLAGVLERASVATLEELLHLAYRYIRPEDDAVHDGTYSPDARDHAENARNELLSTLIKCPGADAYRAMRRAADHPSFKSRAGRFHELARGKAEQDSELPAWTVTELLTFEQKHVAPAKTGDDLLRVTIGVLNDIRLGLTRADATTRPLLARAIDEDEVQHWLVEQMNFRSKGQFHVHREAEVALGDKPDIIVSSTSAQCEVAIEVKHGGMGWTARQLREALKTQLAEDYLKPLSRRHGVLVITNHRDRQWLHPGSNKPLKFPKLLEWMTGIAKSVVENDSGAIEVACIGIDASEATDGVQRAQKRRVPSRDSRAKVKRRLARKR